MLALTQSLYNIEVNANVYGRNSKLRNVNERE
jgi:hypothetical protein